MRAGGRLVLEAEDVEAIVALLRKFKLVLCTSGDGNWVVALADEKVEPHVIGNAMRLLRMLKQEMEAKEE